MDFYFNMAHSPQKMNVIDTIDDGCYVFLVFLANCVFFLKLYL